MIRAWERLSFMVNAFILRLCDIKPIEACDSECELPDGHTGWCGWGWRP